jgi:hypothetical protein
MRGLEIIFGKFFSALFPLFFQFFFFFFFFVCVKCLDHFYGCPEGAVVRPNSSSPSPDGHVSAFPYVALRSNET